VPLPGRPLRRPTDRAPALRNPNWHVIVAELQAAKLARARRAGLGAWVSGLRRRWGVTYVAAGDGERDGGRDFGRRRARAVGGLIGAHSGTYSGSVVSDGCGFAELSLGRN